MVGTAFRPRRLLRVQVRRGRLRRGAAHGAARARCCARAAPRPRAPRARRAPPGGAQVGCSDPLARSLSTGVRTWREPVRGARPAAPSSAMELRPSRARAPMRARATRQKVLHRDGHVRGRAHALRPAAADPRASTSRRRSCARCAAGSPCSACRASCTGCRCCARSCPSRSRTSRSRSSGSRRRWTTSSRRAEARARARVGGFGPRERALSRSDDALFFSRGVGIATRPRGGRARSARSRRITKSVCVLRGRLHGLRAPTARFGFKPARLPRARPSPRRGPPRRPRRRAPRRAARRGGRARRGVRDDLGEVRVDRAGERVEIGEQQRAGASAARPRAAGQPRRRVERERRQVRPAQPRARKPTAAGSARSSAGDSSIASSEKRTTSGGVGDAYDAATSARSSAGDGANASAPRATEPSTAGTWSASPATASASASRRAAAARARARPPPRAAAAAVAALGGQVGEVGREREARARSSAQLRERLAVRREPRDGRERRERGDEELLEERHRALDRLVVERDEHRACQPFRVRGLGRAEQHLHQRAERVPDREHGQAAALGRELGLGRAPRAGSRRRAPSSQSPRRTTSRRRRSRGARAARAGGGTRAAAPARRRRRR